MKQTELINLTGHRLTVYGAGKVLFRIKHDELSPDQHS